MPDDIVEGTKIVVENSRKEDPICMPERVEKKISNRKKRTYGGFVIASGATIFAFVHPEFYLQAFIIGLVGAGIIDPSFVYSKITGKGE